jgi:hypothetical protein
VVFALLHLLPSNKDSYSQAYFYNTIQVLDECDRDCLESTAVRERYVQPGAAPSCASGMRSLGRFAEPVLVNEPMSFTRSSTEPAVLAIAILTQANGQLRPCRLYKVKTEFVVSYCVPCIAPTFSRKTESIPKSV